MEKCYSMDKIILQSVLYSTWVSATGTQVFQHFIIFILAPGTRCGDEGSYTLLINKNKNDMIPVKSHSQSFLYLRL